MKQKHYFSGGFAEIVSQPSLVTYSFFSEWFTGKASLGKAMQLLGLPFEQNSLSILAYENGELYVDLDKEEKVLYKKTLFGYARQKDVHQIPRLILKPKKLLNPLHLLGTTKIISVQSQWISNPDATFAKAKYFLEQIPRQGEKNPVRELDEILALAVWPYVIAVGTITEFYYQLLIHDCKDKTILPILHNAISQQVAQKDWFFTSLFDMEKVKEKKMSFSDYISLYGLRADKDYDLASPRWHEIQPVIKERIQQATPHTIHQETDLPNLDTKLQKLIALNIALQIIRTETKRKTLFFVDALRTAIIKSVGTKDIAEWTKEDILKRKKSQTNKTKAQTESAQDKESEEFGTGRSVCAGEVTGIVYHITNPSINVAPNTIGIFPNASPEFAMHYPKCKGMIFLRGGQTSHGAIVAREYGIPALIDPHAQGIKNGKQITINGLKGTWRHTNS